MKQFIKSEVKQSVVYYSMGKLSTIYIYIYLFLFIYHLIKAEILYPRAYRVFNETMDIKNGDIPGGHVGVNVLK